MSYNPFLYKAAMLKAGILYLFIHMTADTGMRQELGLSVHALWVLVSWIIFSNAIFFSSRRRKGRVSILFCLLRCYLYKQLNSKHTPPSPLFHLQSRKIQSVDRRCRNYLLMKTSLDLAIMSSLSQKAFHIQFDYSS